MIQSGNPEKQSQPNRTPLMKLIRTLILSALLTGSPALIHAQDFSKDYSPISSTGFLPPIFVKSFSQKAIEDVSKIKDKNHTTLTKKKQFAIESNFHIDHLVRSGSILFNDSISAYVNKVLDEILKNDPELRSSIQLFVIKSPLVNAFSFDNGIILVNTGLLSQLDDESQLAFILCHELIHYKRKHSINAYLDLVNVSNTSYKKSRTDADVLNYSKDQETEADTAGLELFKSTNYDFDAVHSAFDVMQYSYLPFDEQEFTRDFLEDNNLHFPKDYFLDKTAPIKADDNYDDSKSSHPNIRKRKTAVNSRLDASYINKGRKKFIVSEKRFNHAKDIARFETCRLYLLDLDYPNAIYSSFILLKKYPKNIYLKKIVSKSLYEIASYKSSLHGAESVTNVFGSDAKYELKSFEDIEGFSQQVYYLLQKLSSEEATTLALNYSWKLNSSLGYADKQEKQICDSLFVILIQGNEKSLADYSRKSRAEIVLEDSLKKVPVVKADIVEGSAPDTVKREVSKYEKIKAQQKKEEVVEIITHADENFTRYAFVDLLKDKAFANRFQYFLDQKPTSSPSKKHSYNSYSERRKTAKSERKFGRAMGIDKVVIVEPFFYHMDLNNKQKMDFKATVSGLQNFQTVIKDNATKAKLDYVTLDPQHMKEDDVTSYNDFVNTNDWINERLMHGYNARALVTATDNKDALIAKYGTNYFMWTGVVSVTNKGLRGTYTYIYVIVYDMAKEIAVYSETRQVKMRDSQATLNSQYYDIFNQMHQPAPKSKTVTRASTDQDSN
jgi:predicted Zn-dependent protease